MRSFDQEPEVHTATLSSRDQGLADLSAAYKKKSAEPKSTQVAPQRNNRIAEHLAVIGAVAFATIGTVIYERPSIKSTPASVPDLNCPIKTTSSDRPGVIICSTFPVITEEDYNCATVGGSCSCAMENVGSCGTDDSSLDPSGI